jgi:hypothetical protein
MCAALHRHCHRPVENHVIQSFGIVSVSEIIGIVSDMHACASQIIKHFSTKMSPGEHSADSLNSNPAKLCFVVKQSVREAAVGGYLKIFGEDASNHSG